MKPYLSFWLSMCQGIRVQVRSVYIEGRSLPSKGQYFFAYRIRITNNSQRPVQLLRRHWIITDANGKTENIWSVFHVHCIFFDVFNYLWQKHPTYIVCCPVLLNLLWSRVLSYAWIQLFPTSVFSLCIAGELAWWESSQLFFPRLDSSIPLHVH